VSDAATSFQAAGQVAKYVHGDRRAEYLGDDLPNTILLRTGHGDMQRSSVGRENHDAVPEQLRPRCGFDRWLVGGHGVTVSHPPGVNVE
jgi:hypothetical protein